MTEYRKASRTSAISYGGKDPDVLRSVLHSLYKSRCYWCGKLKDFADIETDHIIPKTLRGRALEQALSRLGLPHDFDLNNPANLAPICGRCNGPGTKGSLDMTHLPVVASHLRTAQRFKPEVERRVREFTNRRGLAAAFVTLSAADLDDEQTRTFFKENMPSIVRKQAAAGDDLADFALYRVVEVEVGGGELLETAIELEYSSKRAAQLLETLGGVPIQTVVQAPIADLWQQIHDRVQSALEGTGDEEVWGPTTSGPPTAHYFRVDITAAESLRSKARFEFTFSGEFESHLAASLVRDNPHGWTTTILDLQGDAVVQGTFTFTATWDAGEGDDLPYAEEATIESWEQDVWTTETG
ncbi:hypothetical protein ABKW28_00995 [Nocardioides sp. 31GB23]|uniref:HNH endonuclease n=1 Tax=Nocardioides sp. 31GB23 TaxID=3156065 RepID=UPI0032AEFAAA